MAQFSVYRNPDPASRKRVPLFLDVQSRLISELGTRVVVPLCPAAQVREQVMKTLTPVFEIGGTRYAMITPQIAGLSRKQIGKRVCDLETRRDEIIAALDFLITGI